MVLYLVSEIVASFIFWTSLYLLFCQLNPGRSSEWHCREVTFLHAITVIALAAWCGFVQGPWPFTHPGGDTTPLQSLTLTICLGYFLFDFLWCLYFGTEGGVMLLHHVFSIIGLSGVLFRGYGGTEMIAAIFGAEFTNPFLQLRWFLRSTGRHKTWYAEINDILFMSLFGIMRLGIGSNLLYCYLKHPRPDGVTKMCAVLFYLIGVLFWIMIVRYAINKYRKAYRLWKGDNKQSSKSSEQDTQRNGGHSEIHASHANGITPHEKQA